MGNKQAMIKALENLERSTREFHQRFNTPTDLAPRLRVMWEEVGELLMARTDDERAEEAADVIVTAMGCFDAFECEGHSMDLDELVYCRDNKSDNLNILGNLATFVMSLYRDDTPDSIYDELPDIIWYSVPFTTPEAINAVAAKNDAKTLDTHELGKHGKVTRKV
jgi:hypothetical protein